MDIDPNTNSSPAIVPAPPRRFHILDFPDEVLIQIVEFANEFAVPYHNLRGGISANPIVNFRMTCRRFRDISAHLLVPSITVGFESSSLDRLDAISRHPIICKGVRHITVSLNFLDEQLRNYSADFVHFHSKKLREHANLEWGTKESHFGRGGRSEGPNHEDDKEDEVNRALLKEAHAKFKEAYDNQELLKTSGNFVKTVVAAIARMPLARSLSLRDSVERRTAPWPIPVRPGVDVREAYYTIMRMGMTRRDAADYGLQSSNLYSTMLQLPLAIYRAGVTLESFQMFIFGLESSLDLMSSPETLAELSMSMKHLQKFGFEGSGTIDRNEIEHLTKFLGGCLNTSSLKDISLRPSGRPTRPYAFELTFSSLISPTIALDTLTIIDLHEIICEADEITEFISRLPHKLQKLELGHVRLIGDGLWEPILDRLREKEYGDLALFPIYGGEGDDMSHEIWQVLFDKPRDEEFRPSRLSAVERYVLRQLEDNPLMRHRTGTWVDNNDLDDDDESEDDGGEDDGDMDWGV